MRDRSRMTLRAKRRIRPPGEADSPAPHDQFAATPDKMLPFVRALAHDTEKQLRAGLGHPVTLPALLTVAESAHHQYEQTWRYVQNLNVVPHACQAGCAFCCYLTVETTAPEAFLIAEHLRATYTPTQLESLQENIRRTAASLHGLTPTERVQATIPCALLKDGLCSVHSVRPLACRSWNSRDARACEQVLREGVGDLRPVQDQRPEGINAGVHAGLLAALRGAGLPEEAGHQCELNTALQIALDDPTATERWLGGEDVLQPSRSAVRYFEEIQEILA